ncbi:KpsF/GutQ family sugar-phosphate isomerase [Quatrionicoccus australiensis]|uniref:KpsF/GutQ family sugar-phosphate isomerase n=1 Tax=Quatrionicoccus australiensis TaxID=138118 RepID=UPI001CFC4245|nr:KpsF/GutQ family sugar-phosphate isomerase [Quatrionicoccus australiensis]MCB4358667.1 KpsF/GutQ family sugar-phosphate isomerase [Quatrionicoccus australiensis]
MIDYINIAKRVIEIEASGVAGLAKNLDSSFNTAISQIINSKGRVIICGMGKSGIVGRKISATLASTGTPSFFMHPAEAYHGDLGMVAQEDVFIAISYSGETDELLKLIPFLKNNRNYIVSLTGYNNSSLAKAADCNLNIQVLEEACPLQLAPTASTTATLAMGDALAVTLMTVRGFKPENFARFHPGGSLGRRLLSTVGDEMIRDNLPLVSPGSKVIDLMQAMTLGKLGIAIVYDGYVLGIITDGDIRRSIQKCGNLIFELVAEDFMTKSPTSVPIQTRVEDALVLMGKKQITTLLVYDDNALVGVFKK